MKKKLIAMALTGTLLLSPCTSVFADENFEVEV